MKKLSIGFLPNIKRKNLKTGKTQIVMRVIVDGLKKEVRLPEIYDLSDADLSKWNYFSHRLDSKNSDVNDYLSAIYSRRKLLDLDNLKDSKALSPGEIIDKLLGRVELKKEITIYDYAKRYLREEIENSSKKIGTKKNYRNAINQFCIFLELKDWTKLPIKEFKFENANLFKKYLETPLENLNILGIDRNECLKLYAHNESRLTAVKKKIKLQNCIVSSSTKIKNIKPIFEKAVDEDLIVKNPFSKIKLCFEGSEEAGSLTISMLKRVYDLKCLDSGLNYTKDLFLFMCFTGFAYVDTLNFNTKEFEVVDGEMHLLQKSRVKTGCPIRQVLCNQAKGIVIKFLDSGFGANGCNVFPFESSESLNRKLKVIQSLAQIPFELSTKNGRITFKNLIRESNIQNVFLTKKLMGWKSNKTIEDIYNRFTQNDFLVAKNTFDKYLDTHLVTNENLVY